MLWLQARFIRILVRTSSLNKPLSKKKPLLGLTDETPLQQTRHARDSGSKSSWDCDVLGFEAPSYDKMFRKKSTPSAIADMRLTKID